jgi:hypothetical protein
MQSHCWKLQINIKFINWWTSMRRNWLAGKTFF